MIKQFVNVYIEFSNVLNDFVHQKNGPRRNDMDRKLM